MSTVMTNTWRPERLFAMPSVPADSFRGLGLAGSALTCNDAVSLTGYVSNEQVKPAQPNHSIPVGASST